MTHYAQIFTINNQRFSANLGYYDHERAVTQLISVDLRLYFPIPPECANTDQAPFIDYAILIQAMKDYVEGKEFSLIEYLATQFFAIARGIMSEQVSHDIKLWLRLTKVNPPIPGLMDGASYVLSDLPAGATFPPAV